MAVVEQFAADPGYPTVIEATQTAYGPYALPREAPLYDIAKRALDIAIAAVAMIGLLPVWIAIAVAIKLSSPGPIIYRAVVVGKGGRPFTWYKFRTMLVTGDEEHRSWLKDFVLLDQPYRNGAFKLHPDPRVTKIGALLRRTSLDEVPQLVNVIRGEMSIVGPRPPIQFEFDLYDDARKGRLAVRPGITGLHQVTGRNRVPFSVMLARDLEYIHKRSLRLDLAIILRTALVMLQGR